MKPKSFLLMGVLGSIIWIVFPLLFIWLNRFFNLPVIIFFPLQLLGGLLINAALATIAYLFFLFRIHGEGTPVPIQPAKKVIRVGLYRYTRNPMYICHLVIILSEWLLFGYTFLLTYLFLLWLGFNWFVTAWEEPDLKKRLGKPYLEYLTRVPRWL